MKTKLIKYGIILLCFLYGFIMYRYAHNNMIDNTVIILQNNQLIKQNNYIIQQNNAIIKKLSGKWV